MVRTRFGASDFCRLTGISAETLRHYAECGIIDTVDIETNNYKKYSAKNAMDVLHARMCRGLEIPIPNIILKAGGSLDEQESLMRRHEAVLQIEARQLSLKLERMRQQIEFLAFARERLDKVQERAAEEVPNLFRLMIIGENVERNSETRRIITQWMENPQYTHVAIRAPMAALLDPSTDALPMSIGIGMREEFVARLKLDTRPPVEYLPKARNIGTVIATFDPLSLRKSDIRGVFDSVEEMGCQIVSDLVGRLCTYLETDQGRLYYFTVSFCIN